MPRVSRVNVAGEIYHVINRANARLQIFDNEKDYQLFEKVLVEAKDRFDIDIYSYCIMPNHWHFVLSPKENGGLPKFIGWLTMTHTQRWHVIHKSIGSGHLYQGRYKSFLVQKENYFLQLCRYVERNPLRAGLVKNGIDWEWSSLWRRERGDARQKEILSAWPANVPDDYMDWINKPEIEKELMAIRHSVNKGKPYGEDNWVDKITDLYKLKSTLRNPGRPRKGS